ncbi:hypothetical protein BGZ81_009511 [Podila clonocystis]|nr:hypothetical protein BGZ81_009511 [Podila clonocystis]
MTNTTGAFQEWTDDIEKARANLGIQGMSVTVVLKGGGQGFDSTVIEYLPEFKLKDPRLTAEINFIDLLAHRTGYFGQDFEWYHRSKDWIEVIKLLRYVDPVAPLRSRFIYNNSIVCVAGEAAGRIAGTASRSRQVVSTCWHAVD